MLLRPPPPVLGRSRRRRSSTGSSRCSSGQLAIEPASRARSRVSPAARCSDAVLGRLVEPALQSVIMSSPRVMRELPRLLPKSGLRLIATQAHVYAEASSSRFMLNLAETYGPLAASTGLLPAAQVETWLADQRRSAADGTFFGACNYYAYITRR